MGGAVANGGAASSRPSALRTASRGPDVSLPVARVATVATLRTVGEHVSCTGRAGYIGYNGYNGAECGRVGRPSKLGGRQHRDAGRALSH
jgi:hypothetical protein